MTKNKIFLIDGGAGRHLCSIPAFEHYALTHDNFKILSIYKNDFFIGNPILEKRTHHLEEKDLFTNIIKDSSRVVMPEPYHRREYFNQECSIAQCWDLEINGKHSIGNKAPKIYFNSSENTKYKNFIEALKHEYKKDKVLIFQPFGEDAKPRQGSLPPQYTGQIQPSGIHTWMEDLTARSFEIENINTIVPRLKKDYLILCMGGVRLNISNIINGVNIPDNTLIYLDTTLRNWAGYIKFADHFLGCDSVGQHLAKSVNQRSTVVIGGTFPVNVSYPNDDKFTIFDLGKDRRIYDPLRLVQDHNIFIANQGIMKMSDVIIDKIIHNIVSCS